METNKPPFILLEGMDLSGKSSVRSKLQGAYPDWKTTHIGLSDNKTMYAVAHKVNKVGTWTFEEIGYLYVAGLTVELSSFEWPLQPTLQDSCMLLRSLAHHSARDNKTIVSKLERLAEQHPRFTKAFVFTASIESRVKRLQKRMQENPTDVNVTDELVLSNPTLFSVMDKTIISYAQKYFNAELVDTTTITVDETFDLVKSKLVSFL